jgi:peptidoglycan/xylan/chitin deacetylase (PgdA/CDA1 family)
MPEIPVGMKEATENRDNHLNEFVMFVYHRFGDPKHLSTNITIDDFRRQLEFLKSENFEVMTLSNALEAPFTEGRKRAVITIDDSFRSFYENGFSVLKEFDFPATLFVSTSTVGGEDYLTWKELGELRDSGIEIGNHSHSHAYFLDLNKEVYLDSFRNDVLEAQRLFKKHLSLEPTLFAYPYGEYDPSMQEEVKQMGFKAATAQNSGIARIGHNTYSLPRFPISDAYADIQSFKDKATARSFHITFEDPQSPVITPGSIPEWKLILNESISRARIQCFVEGGFGVPESSGDTLIIRSEKPLTNRRTLYTITMPDGEGRWYWRSHVWIIPDSTSTRISNYP